MPRLSREVGTEMNPGTVKPVIRSLVISLAGMVVIAVAGLWYTNHVDQQAEERTRIATAAAIADSNRKWCDIVAFFDDTYKANPPTTETGKRLSVFFAARRIDFGC